MNEISETPLAAPESSYSPEDRENLTDQIVTALRTVYDPEISVNIFDLGLIYRIGVRGRGNIDIDMTLTAPGCPVAGEMVNMTKNAVLTVDGVDHVDVTLVFDPPWDQSKMSEEAQLEMGLI